jgi:hypothetical protein
MQLFIYQSGLFFAFTLAWCQPRWLDSNTQLCDYEASVLLWCYLCLLIIKVYYFMHFSLPRAASMYTPWDDEGVFYHCATVTSQLSKWIIFKLSLSWCQQQRLELNLLPLDPEAGILPLRYSRIIQVEYFLQFSLFWYKQYRLESNPWPLDDEASILPLC